MLYERYWKQTKMELKESLCHDSIYRKNLEVVEF